MRVFTVILLLFMCTRMNFAQQVNGTILQKNENLIVVKVWGTHQERGFACGYLLADKFVSLHNNYFKPRFGSNLTTAKEMIVKSSHFKIPVEYIKEAQAMVSGMEAAGVDLTGIDYRDILVQNCFLDIENISTFKNEEINLGNGCSSLMSWGDATVGTFLNGKSVISRHVDWEINSYLIANQAIIIHIPSEEDEQPWLLIGFVGQMGVLSGVNQNGLCLFNQSMPGFGYGSLNKAYEPIWFTMRKALEKKDFNGDMVQDTRDIRDAILTNSNGYANGFIISSIAPSTAGADSLVALISELTPTIPYFTFRTNSYDDKIPGDNLYAANESIARNDSRRYCPRYDRMAACMTAKVPGGSIINETENWAFLRDYSNTEDNIQFMQVIPEQNILNLSLYLNSPAFRNDSIQFDLEVLFSNGNALQGAAGK